MLNGYVVKDHHNNGYMDLWVKGTQMFREGTRCI